MENVRSWQSAALWWLRPGILRRYERPSRRIEPGRHAAIGRRIPHLSFRVIVPVAGRGGVTMILPGAGKSASGDALGRSSPATTSPP
jgi:hypothetical protein